MLNKTESEVKPERILIVDDQDTQRKKMTMAVEALGYSVDTASNGKEALLKLTESSYDLLLLDILMPEVDGFDVMEFLKKDSKLKDIPIIVISALDNQMESVVKAIKLGAQDFLPKQFDPVLLNARIDTSLSNRRARKRELEYLQEVGRLTDAAKTLESGHINPQRLGLQTMCERDDALGNLARVFTGMATEVYERERKLYQQVRTLKSIGLLLTVGIVSGLGIVLSRVAAMESTSAFGIVFSVNLVCATICFSSAWLRGRMPRINMRLLLVFLTWAILATVIAESVIFSVAQHLPASYIALILVCEGFLVFGFASIMRIEKATWRRLAGFGVGFIGVVLVIISTHQTGAISAWHWGLMALIAPLGYALRTILLTVRLPDDVDMIAANGWCAFLSVLMLLPIVYVRKEFISLDLDIANGGGVLAFSILLFGVVSAVSVSMRVHLIRSAGAVFASQASFVVTFAGIAWSMVLLGEKLPKQAWVALFLLVVGLLLVGPKDEAEEVDPMLALDQK